MTPCCFDVLFALCTATEAALGIIEANGGDPEKFRGMIANSKDWAKERFMEFLEEYFGDEYEEVQKAIDVSTALSISPALNYYSVA